MTSCAVPDCNDQNTRAASSVRMIVSALIGFLLVLAAEGRVGDSSELDFCTETKQCLLFDLICETENYEVRHYGPTKWVSTDETSFFMDIAVIRAFKRLYEYIDGGNDAGQKIEMTAPVIVKVTEKRFWQMGEYTLSFLLPAEHQLTPPRPTNEAVYTHEMPAMNVYVRSYGQWMTAISDRKMADSLSGFLDSIDANYEKNFHYAVVYNSPWKMFNRHNEVWFVTKDDPECSSSEEMESSPVS